MYDFTVVDDTNPPIAEAYPEWKSTANPAITVLSNETRRKGAANPRGVVDTQTAYREVDGKKRVSARLIGASLILQNGDNSSGGPCN